MLGNALEGVDVNAEDKMESNKQVEDPEKMSKDEKLEVEEKAADALEANIKQHAPEIDENIDSEDSAMEESSQEEGEDGDKMETAEKTVEKTEEVGNLQLASETLELELELEAKLCDAYLCLGEVSIENEKYSQVWYLDGL